MENNAEQMMASDEESVLRLYHSPRLAVLGPIQAVVRHSVTPGSDLGGSTSGAAT